VITSLLFGFIKDSLNVNIEEGLDKCHDLQFLALGIVAAVTICIQIISGMLVVKEQNIKKRHGFQASHEIEFTIGKTLFLVFCGFLIGIMANILGLGGGFVIFPMLVAIGVSPLVSSACTMYLILLSKIVAAIFAFLSVYFLPGYTFLTVVLVCLSILFFVKVMDEIIKK
jgi:uncharacterized membrane protein YfcA